MAVCFESESGDGLIPTSHKPSLWCPQNSDLYLYEAGISNPSEGDDSDGWMSEGDTPPVYWYHPTPCSSQHSSPEELPPDGQTATSHLSQNSDGDQASILVEQEDSWSMSKVEMEENVTYGLKAPLDLFPFSETELPFVSLDENIAAAASSPTSSSSSFEIQAVDTLDDSTVTTSDFFQIFEEESPPVSADVLPTFSPSPEVPDMDAAAEQEVTTSDLNRISEIEPAHVFDHVPFFCPSFESEAEEIPTEDMAVHPDLLRIFEEELSPLTSDEDANPEEPTTPYEFPEIIEVESPPIFLDSQLELCPSTEIDEEVLDDQEEIHATEDLCAAQTVNESTPSPSPKPQYYNFENSQVTSECWTAEDGSDHSPS